MVKLCSLLARSDTLTSDMAHSILDVRMDVKDNTIPRWRSWIFRCYFNVKIRQSCDLSQAMIIKEWSEIVIGCQGCFDECFS